MIVSHEVFEWFLSAMTGGVGGYWAIVDSFRLRRALRDDRTDLVVRDRIFGSGLGVVVGLVGVLGMIIHLSR